MQTLPLVRCILFWFHHQRTGICFPRRGISFLVHSPPFSLLRSLDKPSLHFCLEQFFLCTSFLPFPLPLSHPVPPQLFSESKDVPCFQASLAFASWLRSSRFRQPPVRAALGLGVMARALHGGDEAAVPHAGPTQLAQVVQAAGDAGQEVELVQQTPRLEGRQTQRQPLLRRARTRRAGDGHGEQGTDTESRGRTRRPTALSTLP